MGDDESGFRNYFEMLETLAENRDLQPNIKEAEQMLTQVDVTKFASYGWGMRDGLERGIREGEFKKAQEIARIAGLPLEEIQKLRIQH